MDVRPAPGELLSSWLHRLAHANGVPPRYFGAVLGVAGETWSKQLDRHLPDAVRRVLLDHTSICPDEIDGLCLACRPLSTLRLRLRTRPQHAGTSTAQSCWLQFCPSCLREDEVPYFRRSWALGSRLSCFRHGCRLRDRCPSCGQGLAPFRQARLVPQQYCAFCDAPLAKPTGPASTGARRLERLIDDLLRLDSTGRAQDDRKSLAAQLMKHPVPVGTATSTIPFLSHRVRYNFFQRLSERQIEARDPTERGPLTFWLGLARASKNLKGLVGTLRDRLGETAGPVPASFSREPDLTTLLQAAVRVYEGRQFPVEARQVV
ncbi:MAG: TniQ family protein [Tabrizicola sp.]